MVTIRRALNSSTKKLNLSNISSAALDAEILLLEALNKCDDTEHGIAASLCGAPRNDNSKLNKSLLYINNNYELNKNEEELFNDFISQRLKHKPVAYIINRKEFYGYDFYVDENVLIPRPETEIIIEEVLKILAINKKFNIIDIGTGSGCIIISILNELTKNKNDKVIHSAYANDVSQEAIKIAKVNAEKYNLNKKIKFVENNFEKFLDKENIYNSDELIITANLPYIKNADYQNLSVNVKKYEPKIALAAGKNGLVYIEKLIESILKIREKYKQKIYIFIEADPDQMNKIKALLKNKFKNVVIKIIKDLSRKERVISAKIT